MRTLQVVTDPAPVERKQKDTADHQQLRRKLSTTQQYSTTAAGEASQQVLAIDGAEQAAAAADAAVSINSGKYMACAGLCVTLF